MRKILHCIFICGLILISCDKETIPECDIENPLEELEWLKGVKNSLTDCSCQISILQGKYKEMTVFYLMLTDPLCNSAFNIVIWD